MDVTYVTHRMLNGPPYDDRMATYWTDSILSPSLQKGLGNAAAMAAAIFHCEATLTRNVLHSDRLRSRFAQER